MNFCQAASLRSSALERQLELLPLAPRARVEPAFAAREREPVQDDAGRDARAAVGDELAARVARAAARSRARCSAPGMRPGSRSTGFGSPRQRSGRRASTTHELVAAAAPAPRARSCRPSRSRGTNSAGSTCLLAAAQRPEPAVELEHGAVVVAEVAQQPPEPLGAAHVPVGDDEDALADPGPRGGARRSRPALGSGCRPPAPGGAREVARRRRGTTRPGCARRGSARARVPAMPSSQRQSTNW